MNKFKNTLLAIIFLYSYGCLGNVYASASLLSVKNKNLIVVSDDNGQASFSYDQSKVKGVGIELIEGNVISFRYPNQIIAGKPTIVFKNGQFQDVSWGRRIKGTSGISFTHANGDLIWKEISIQRECPTICIRRNLQWTGQTNINGRDAICECKAIPKGTCLTIDVTSEPIRHNEHAKEVCPQVCESQHGKWNGQWVAFACGCKICK